MSVYHSTKYTLLEEAGHQAPHESTQLDRLRSGNRLYTQPDLDPTAAIDGFSEHALARHVGAQDCFDMARRQGQQRMWGWQGQVICFLQSSFSSEGNNKLAQRCA